MMSPISFVINGFLFVLWVSAGWALLHCSSSWEIFLTSFITASMYAFSFSCGSLMLLTCSGSILAENGLTTSSASFFHVTYSSYPLIAAELGLPNFLAVGSFLSFYLLELSMLSSTETVSLLSSLSCLCSFLLSGIFFNLSSLSAVPETPLLERFFVALMLPPFSYALMACALSFFSFWS